MPGESEATQRTRSLAPGSRLGRYTIVRRIGSGGMAELYLARARGIGGFDKLLALKLVLPRVAHDPEFVAMFLDEARLAATLDHGNIAHVVDIGQVGEDYFFAMEYVHGLDLRAICRGVPGPLPIEVALTILLGVAAGLHHAHERRGPDGHPLGVVHRDVSPSNVLVTYDGVVKLVDFGIARAGARSGATQAGVVKGKRGYMSPEQCRGDEVDRRSDVFGLGILLWELTVGQRLFGGDSDYDAMSKIVFGLVPDPRQLVPEFPAPLAEIVMRALHREADARQPTAQAFALELESFVQATGLRTSNHLLAEFIGSRFGIEPHPTSTPAVVVDEDAMTRQATARIVAPRRTALVPAAGLVVAMFVGGTWFFAQARVTEPSDAGSPRAGSPDSGSAGADSTADTPVTAAVEPVASGSAPPKALPAAPVPLELEAPIEDDAEPILIAQDETSPAPPTSRGRRTRGGATPRTRADAPKPAQPASAAGAPLPSRPNQLFPPRE